MESKRLEIISAKELQNTVLPKLNIIVENMIYQGLTILASPPKYGKSWLMLDLCLSVSSGKQFLGHDTKIGNCLYLALEDGKHRLQNRMEKILNGEQSSEYFDFVIHSATLDSGLIAQLEDYISKHKDTNLIVIDTFQKVRGTIKSNQSYYSNDYKEVGELKKIADKYNIAVVVVHHLRKTKDDSDIFNQISGTNGISGAADTMIVMSREKRFNNQTKMSIIGRDIESSELLLEFDNLSFKWIKIGNIEEQEEIIRKKQYNSNPLVVTIKKLVKDSPKGLSIKSSELLEKCLEINSIFPKECTASAISRSIKKLEPDLERYDNIYHNSPNPNGGAAGRKHYFYIKQ